MSVIAAARLKKYSVWLIAILMGVFTSYHCTWAVCTAQSYNKPSEFDSASPPPNKLGCVDTMTTSSSATGCDDSNPWRSCAYLRREKGPQTFTSSDADGTVNTILGLMKMKSGDEPSFESKLKTLIQDFSTSSCQSGKVNGGARTNNIASTTYIPTGLFGAAGAICAFGGNTNASLSKITDLRRCLTFLVSGSVGSYLTFKNGIQPSLDSIDAYVKTNINDPFQKLTISATRPFVGIQYCPAYFQKKASDVMNAFTFTNPGSNTKLNLSNYVSGADKTMTRSAFIRSNETAAQTLNLDAQYGFHTFGTSCGHIARTLKVVKIVFPNDSANLSDPQTRITDLDNNPTTLDTAFPPGIKLAKVRIIASSSALNNGGAYCKKGFRQLSRDRLTAVKTALGSRLPASVTFPDGTKTFDEEFGGYNGDGTSGPCPYTCSGGATAPCAETSVSAALTATTALYQYVVVGGWTESAAGAGAPLNITAARQCFDISLACDPYQPKY